MKNVIVIFALVFLQVYIYAQESRFKSYPIDNSEKNFFTITNFSIKNKSIHIQIANGYALLGSTSEGFTEAIIIPEDGKINGMVNDLTIDDKIDNLYLRFNPKWHTNHLSQFLQNSPLKDSVFEKAINIHKEKFKNYFHAGWDAIIPPDTILICDFTLLSSRMRIATMGEQCAVLSDISKLFRNYKKDKFTIYYPENSVIADKLEEWLDVREKAFQNICNYLKTDGDNVNKITFFVFNDKKQGMNYGRRLGYAVPSKYEIYTTFDQTPGHELTHLVSYWINKKRIKSAVINEGLAVYQDQTERNYNRICKSLISEGKVSVDILKNLLGDDFRKQIYGYPLGASFVSYLIEIYGLYKFKDFFTQEEYNEIDSFKHFYNKDGEQLINEWKEYILKADYGELTAKEKKYLSVVPASAE